MMSDSLNIYIKCILIELILMSNEIMNQVANWKLIFCEINILHILMQFFELFLAAIHNFHILFGNFDRDFPLNFYLFPRILLMLNFILRLIYSKKNKANDLNFI